MRDLLGDTKEVTGKEKSAAALAKVNEARAAKKVVKVQEGGQGGEQDVPKSVKSFAELNLLSDRLF